MTDRVLIVPCAGRSSRFPGMRPKWMLTHPDGQLMVQKAIEGADPARFSKIVFVIARPHDDEYGAQAILRQAFADVGERLRVVVLEDFTSGQADTVCRAIEGLGLAGPILIRDSDNHLSWDDQGDAGGFVVTGDLQKSPDVRDVGAKSYVRLDENGIILDIVEKKVVSETFCAGAYQFGQAGDFVGAFHEMAAHGAFGREAFISHVIGWMIARHGAVFKAYPASSYEDWGTLAQWRQAQGAGRAFFCDVDGVLLRHVGRYGTENWTHALEPLPENIKALKALQARGAQIVLLTGRDETHRERLLQFFEGQGLRPHALITGCAHSQRVIINDFAPTNPCPSCVAVSLPRDGDLAPYLESFLS